MMKHEKRVYGRILRLCCALCLPLGISACRPDTGAGVPPPAAQHAQDIMNNPHVPQSIKDAAQRQAQGQGPAAGAQRTPK